MEQSLSSLASEIWQWPKEINLTANEEADPRSSSIRSDILISNEVVLPQVEVVVNPSATMIDVPEEFNQAFWREANINEETLKAKVHKVVLWEVKDQINIKKGEEVVIHLTEELRNWIDEVNTFKMEMGNLTTLNEVLLMEKKRTVNKVLDYAKSKANIIQIELTILNKKFHNLNSVKKDVFAQCTWERKEKEKLQVIMEELKLTQQEKLEGTK